MPYNQPGQIPLPGYLQQQDNPSWAGAINNMVRALLAPSYRNNQAMQGATAAGMPQGQQATSMPMPLQGQMYNQGMLGTPPPNIGPGSSGAMY